MARPAPEGVTTHALPDEGRPLSAGEVTLFGVAFATFVGASLALAVESPLYGLAVPGVVLAAAVPVLLARVPLGSLCGVVVLFGLTARNEDGLQVEEVVFAAAYLSFLLHWFITRLFVYREPVFRGFVDVAIGAFLVYMTASLGLTVLFGGTFRAAQSDWINFSMFAFYFPIREVCERYRFGPWVVVGFVLYLGLFSVIRNVALLSAAFGNVEYAWEVARGRVAMNEILMLVPALGCLAFASQEPRLRARLLLTAGFAVFTVGVILTQWRAYYVDLALGVFLLAITTGPRGFVRVVSLSALSGAVGLALAYLVFGDLVNLLVLGIADRILSIGTATSVDVSLLNRFLETRQVWDLIVQNPIAGYGLGTTFGFYDTIFNATWVKAYAHNGYLTLWYKFGVFGLLAVLAIWGRAIWVAFGAWADRTGGDARGRTLGLAVAVTLVSLLPSHAVSATFSTADTTFTFALLVGTAVGLYRREQGAWP